MYGKYECFVMQMLYVCVFCASNGSSQCCIMHYLQFVNAEYGLCDCTEMLGICVLYVSFASKIRHRTFGCIAMGNVALLILRSRLLLHSAGSGVTECKLLCLDLV